MAYSEVAGMNYSIINTWVLILQLLSSEENSQWSFSVTWLLAVVVSAALEPAGFPELADRPPDWLAGGGGALCPPPPPAPHGCCGDTVSVLPPLLLPLFSLICRMRSQKPTGQTAAGISAQICYLAFFFGFVNGKWSFMPAYMFTSFKSV